MFGMPFEIGYTCLQFGHTIAPSSTWICCMFMSGHHTTSRTNKEQEKSTNTPTKTSGRHYYTARPGRPLTQAEEQEPHEIK